jgi:hypothetical protein
MDSKRRRGRCLAGNLRRFVKGPVPPQMPSFLILRRRTGGIFRLAVFGGSRDDSLGSLEFQPFHKEKASQSDADPVRRRFRTELNVMEELYAAFLPKEVMIGIVRRRAGYQPGQITSRHVPGGITFSPAAHHGLKIEDDRHGAPAAIPDEPRRICIYFEHGFPICGSLQEEPPSAFPDAV